MGSCANGLSKFDGEVWTHKVNNLSVFLMTSFCTTEGVMWFGSPFGANKFDGNNWTEFTTVDGLISDDITSFTEDNNGDIWIGTNAGLYHYEGVTHEGTIFTNYTVENGLTSNGVTAIACDSKGTIWVGGWNGYSTIP